MCKIASQIGLIIFDWKTWRPLLTLLFIVISFYVWYQIEKYIIIFTLIPKHKIYVKVNVYYPGFTKYKRSRRAQPDDRLYGKPWIININIFNVWSYVLTQFPITTVYVGYAVISERKGGYPLNRRFTHYNLMDKLTNTVRWLVKT